MGTGRISGRVRCLVLPLMLPLMLPLKLSVMLPLMRGLLLSLITSRLQALLLMLLLFLLLLLLLLLLLFLLQPSPTAHGRAQDIQHQGQRQHTIQHQGDDRPQHAALRMRGLSDGHHHRHIQPGNGNQVHESGQVNDDVANGLTGLDRLVRLHDL